MKSLARLALPAMSLLAACAAHPAPRPLAPLASRTSVRGGEFHVTASASGGGDAYDATMLIYRGNDLLRAQHCAEAIGVFERLEREFPTSTTVPLSRFNRGVCLQQLDRQSEAATAFRAAATSTADPTLQRDARFRLAAVGERAEQWPTVIEATDAVLATPTITRIDRVEANGRRAVAMLASGRREEAVRLADAAIAEAPDAEAIRGLGDDTWVARSRYVLAEATRLEAAEIAVRAEAADLEAPLPTQWDERARALYRRRTGERLRPLLTGALRSWEATMTMARRNGILDNEWVRRASDAMADLRRSALREG